LKDHCIITSLSGISGPEGACRRWPSHKRMGVIVASALLMLLVLSLVPGFCSPAAAQQSTPAGKVVIVVIDRIGIDDLSPADSPNILKLAGRGAISLMNARVKYDQYGLGSYLIIGAGGRAIGGPNIGLAFNSTERLKASEGGTVPAGSVYHSRTGRTAPVRSVVNLFIEEMKTKSDVPQASSKPGLLGQTLAANGKKVTVLGNADATLPSSPLDVPPGQDVRVPQKPLQQEPAPVELAPSGLAAVPTPGQQSYPLTSFIHRESVAIAMTAGGKVSRGNVSDELTRDTSTTGDLHTDFARLEAQAKAALPTSDVMVVDMGQTSRVDEQAGFYTESRLTAARHAALRECDSSLGRLASMIDPARDIIVVCTPTPTRKMILDGELLTPLVISGKGYSTGGQLHSATTRRTGLVSNYDIAPTVLEFEGLKTPSEMDGRPVTVTGSQSDIARLVRFQDKAAATFNARRLMVRVYVIASMCIIALFFLVVLLRRDLIDSHPYFWSVPLLAILAGPLMWLLVPVFGALPQAAMIAIAVCGTIILAAASLALRKRSSDEDRSPLSAALLRPILAISGVTLLVIVADLLAGSPLMTFSTFGSDTILGDRYYGIGNLYMGFIVGAALLFACLFPEIFDKALDRPWKRYAVCGAILATTAFFLGFGRLGAEFGGLVTALAGSLVVLAKLEGGKIGLKRAGLIVLIIVICVGIMLAADLLLPGTSSHAGKAVERATSSGTSAFLTQINRKLAADWSLTFGSTWRLVLLVALVAGLVLNWRYRLFGRIEHESPFLYAGFLGMGVAMPIALVLNDSGIEAAAAISIFLFVPYFFLLNRTSKPDSAPSE